MTGLFEDSLDIHFKTSPGKNPLFVQSNDIPNSPDSISSTGLALKNNSEALHV